jgi:predicted transcriptional regulator
MKRIEPEMVKLKGIINKKFGLDLNVNTRKRDYVNARLVYAKILRERGYTHDSIARSIGRDHATIIYYVRCASHIFIQDRFLEKKYLECKTLLLEEEGQSGNPISEEMLSERVSLLSEQVDKLTVDNDLLLHELNEKANRSRRINKIINLIEERTHYGKEELIEKKIREMFNGFAQ